MKTYECFYKGSATFAEREASYKSDFQRRLEEMNRQSSHNWLGERLRSIGERMVVTDNLEQSIDDAFA
jgi:hypothetical protein